jgi:hypothetical protein
MASTAAQKIFHIFIDALRGMRASMNASARKKNGPPGTSTSERAITSR